MQNKHCLLLRTFAVFLAISVCTVFFTACDDGTRAFRITFDANGGTSGTPPDPRVAAPGSTITLPGVGGLLRSGYAFAGWNIRADGTGNNFNYGDAFVPTENITLYAKWNRNPGGGVGRNTASQGTALFSGGTAQRGAFSVSGGFTMLGVLVTTNNTIDVLNRVLR